MNQCNKIVGILLAAGHGRRFGKQNKLLQSTPGQPPIAVLAAKHLVDALPTSIAIVRQPALMDSISKIGLDVMPCPDEAQEMADSLSAAVAYATAQYAPAGYVIALADMPFIQPATISMVVERLLDGAAIVVPVYQGQRGHPVGFSSKFKDELTLLTGDEGARSIIKKYAGEVEFMECDDHCILKDIDIPEDLKN